MILDGIAVALAATALGLSVALLVYYWGDRRWAWQAPPSVRTLADAAVQHECFRLLKQLGLLGLVMASLLAVPALFQADWAVYFGLADVARVLRTAIIVLFILTSLNDLRLRTKARNLFTREQRTQHRRATDE